MIQLLSGQNFRAVTPGFATLAGSAVSAYSVADFTPGAQVEQLIDGQWILAPETNERYRIMLGDCATVPGSLAPIWTATRPPQSSSSSTGVGSTSRSPELHQLAPPVELVLGGLTTRTHR